MSWSKVNRKTKKPLGWWYRKVMCELCYHLWGSGGSYYYHLNKMCDNYKINLYGDLIHGSTDIYEIPENFKPFMMLFDGEWQEAVETTDGTESFGIRWFKGEIIGHVPHDEITEWRPL